MEAILYNRNRDGVVGVVVNSALQVKGTDGFLIWSQKNDPDTFDTMVENTQAVVINRQAMDVQQLSEWGMRMIQRQFLKMKERLLTLEELGDREIILNLFFLL